MKPTPQPRDMVFVGGRLDGQTRKTRGIGFDSHGDIYRPEGDVMVFVGRRARKEP